MDAVGNSPKKRRITRIDRNTSEATIEENEEPFDEIGLTDEEIRVRSEPTDKPQDSGLIVDPLTSSK